MSTKTSTLKISLVDDVSGKAEHIGRALKGASDQARAMARAMSGSGLSKGFVGQLGKLGLDPRDLEKVTASFNTYRQAIGAAGKATDWTKEQTAQVRAWEQATIAALRRVTAEQRAQATAQLEAAVKAGEAQAAARRTAEAEAKRARELAARDQARIAREAAAEERARTETNAREQARAEASAARERARAEREAARERRAAAAADAREARAEAARRARQQLQSAIEAGRESRRERLRARADAERERQARPERTLGPLGGVFGAYEAVNAYKQAAAFDRRITMIGQTADASRAEIDRLGTSVHELAQQTATPVDKLAGGLEALVAQGRNLQEAMGFLPSVARTAAASGSEVDDIAKTADSVGTNFEIAGRQMQKAFDIMAAGGKAGQFELKDMARYLPSLGPAASAIGFKGEKGLADLVAMLQVMRKGSGTAEEAVSSMNNILARMESDKTTKAFKELGVDAEAASKKARKEGRNLVEVFEELVDKALKGDRSRLGEIIDDMEFKRGVQALMSFKGEWQRLSQNLRDTSGGTVMRDLVQVTKDAQAGIDRLSNSWARFTQTAARLADAGGVSKGLGDTSKEFDQIARALERINAAYKEGGLKGAIDQVLGDSKDGQRRNRQEWLEERGKQEDRRVAELEADNKAFREKLQREGHSPESIDRTMRLRERELDKARRRRSGVEAAKQDPDLVGRKPLRFGSDPTAPMQGQPGAITPGIQSWQEAYPLDLSRSRAMPPVVPLPPRRPDSMPRTIDSINDILNPAERRTPEVKPTVDTGAIDAAKQKIDALNQAPVTPQVEMSALERLHARADEARAELERIGTTSVAPQVGTDSLDTATAKARGLLGLLQQIQGAAAGAVSAIGDAASAANGIRARGSSASFQGPDYAGP